MVPFFLLQGLLIAVVAGTVYIHNDRLLILKKPPASLAQWYQPENRRQVWLHNMFKLRREMQAMQIYAERNEAEHLEKWLAQFSEHYLKIGEMVPEWKKKLDPEALAALQQSAGENRFGDVARALTEISSSCKSCHADYRSVTAITYRAPDFGTIKTGNSATLEAHMEQLGEQINRIKIASEDDRRDEALSALSDLTKGMQTLGGTCISCHKKDDKAYPGRAIVRSVEKLQQSLQDGTPGDQGRELGTLAVLACARCHGTHRIAYDIRQALTNRPDWPKLLAH